jgi:hypothetical protein
LAVVGVMFVMLSRIDSMSTSAVAENKDLNFAVDSVIAKIKQTLAEDVPGVRDSRFPQVVVRPEYQDYPLNYASPGLDDIPGTGDDVPLGPGPDGQLETADDWPFGPGPDGSYYTKDDLPYYPGPDGIYGTADDTPYHPGKDGIYGTSDDILMPAFHEQDPWLASLEPRVFDNGTRVYYYWPHITDLYGDYFGLLKGDIWNRLNYYFDPDYKDDIFRWTQGNNESIWYHAGPFNVTAKIINPSDPVDDIIINAGNWSNPAHLLPFGSKADADGDGVADSRWIILPDKTSSKGEPVYAAIRIVDNGGMLNVNTGYKFDPNATEISLVDGSSQLQTNLMNLSWRKGFNNYNPLSERDLLSTRANNAVIDILDPVAMRIFLNGYQNNVIWQYGRPFGDYTPFDISDELELRYRFLVNQSDIDTRLENVGPAKQWEFEQFYLTTPADTNILNWFYRAAEPATSIYSYRHIATTYNLDRIIDATGYKMLGVNRSTSGFDPNELYHRMIRAGSIAPSAAIAQFCANIADFADDDTDVSVVTSGGVNFYGFEAQPFITELGMKIDRYPELGGDRNYYAVELYNPFTKDISLDDFELVSGPADLNDPCNPGIIPLGRYTSTLKADQYLVVTNDLSAFALDPCLPASNLIKAPLRFFGKPVPTPRDRPVTRPIGKPTEPPRQQAYEESYPVLLRRKVQQTDNRIYVDAQKISLDVAAAEQRYFARDVHDGRIVYPHMDIWAVNTLGGRNRTTLNPDMYRFSLYLPDSDYVLSNGRRQRLITIGDVPQVLSVGPKTDPNPDGTVGYLLRNTGRNNEQSVRPNLQNPLFANIFQYLTVFDPTRDGIDNDGDGLGSGIQVDEDERKVPGKINVNTAPWFVIAQLPWMTPQLARAVVAYRDKLPLTPTVDYSLGRNNATGLDLTYLTPLREEPGFASIGELADVINIESTVNPQSSPLIPYDMRQGVLGEGVGFQTNLVGFPDLTPDVIVDDFEERDVIFSRISNLATVRIDVFTAYILVRIGRDGPQKRVVAILDRSDVYPNPNYNPLGIDSSKPRNDLPSIGEVELRALQSVPDPR